MLLGRQAEIHAEPDRKLEQARRLRQLRRKQVVTFPDSPITMTSPEETEAGSDGRQPMLRDTLVGLIEPMLPGAGVHCSRAGFSPCCSRHRTIDPQCLENPRPAGAESTLTENARSPFHAEPRHLALKVVLFAVSILVLVFDAKVSAKGLLWFAGVV